MLTEPKDFDQVPPVTWRSAEGSPPPSDRISPVQSSQIGPNQTGRTTSCVVSQQEFPSSLFLRALLYNPVWILAPLPHHHHRHVHFDRPLSPLQYPDSKLAVGFTLALPRFPREETMKIFDWMHRKLHPCSVKYAQVSQKRDVLGGDDEEKREVLFEGVMEKEALLLHDVLNGILTIGTLGHQDSFISQPYPAQEDELLQEEEENAEDEETEEVKEAAQAVEAAREPLPAIVVESFKFKLPVEAEVNRMEMAVQDVEEAEKIQELPLLKEDKEKRERGRTTLADLFAADAFVVNDPAENDIKRANDFVKQQANPERKKAQRDTKEEKRTPATTKAITNPNRKLQKLMTKMLKKKIHPEMASADTQTKERNKEVSDGSGSRIY